MLIVPSRATASTAEAQDRCTVETIILDRLTAALFEQQRSAQRRKNTYDSTIRSLRRSPRPTYKAKAFARPDHGAAHGR